jgi:tetratricopeptide (TPR) repeat protein
LSRIIIVFLCALVVGLTGYIVLTIPTLFPEQKKAVGAFLLNGLKPEPATPRPKVAVAPALPTPAPAETPSQSIDTANAAVSDLRRGAYKEAEQSLTRSIQSGTLAKGDLELAYVMRAQAYRAEGNLREADNDARQALAIAPDDADALALEANNAPQAAPSGAKTQRPVAADQPHDMILRTLAADPYSPQAAEVWKNLNADQQFADLIAAATWLRCVNTHFDAPLVPADAPKVARHDITNEITNENYMLTFVIFDKESLAAEFDPGINQIVPLALNIFNTDSYAWRYNVDADSERPLLKQNVKMSLKLARGFRVHSVVSGKVLEFSMSPVPISLAVGTKEIGKFDFGYKYLVDRLSGKLTYEQDFLNSEANGHAVHKGLYKTLVTTGTCRKVN